MKLRPVLENCTEPLALNDQYLEATTVGDVGELLELAALGVGRPHVCLAFASTSRCMSAIAIARCTPWRMS